MRILLAQGDSDELDITAYALHREGFRVSTAFDGKATLAKWRSEEPDLVVLETALPKVNGLEICRQIREESQVPLIFLSDRSGDADVVAAFSVGADDYVVKPFSSRQLVARIRAALRRSANSRLRADGPDEKITVGSLLLDGQEHKVGVAGQRVHLTPLEFRLLYCLAANAGRVVSADQLIGYAWGLGDSDAAVLKTHISRIRQKLDAHNLDDVAIRNVAGVGYCLESLLEEAPASSRRSDVTERSAA
ncbi:MAG: response regulator transcription factor [Chloroflexi bacterium]|nr:response regulator transcription factor [Chloroflexota bacterium]